MKLTKKVAKAISLELWRYLRDHPSVKDKKDVPQELFDKIDTFIGRCPVCAYYISCGKCPLVTKTDGMEIGCAHPGVGIYAKWIEAKTPKTRKKYAGIIVDRIEAW